MPKRLEVLVFFLTLYALSFYLRCSFTLACPRRLVTPICDVLYLNAEWNREYKVNYSRVMSEKAMPSLMYTIT